MQLKELIKLTVKKKIILSVGGFSLFIIILICLIIIPTIKDIRAMGNEIELQRIDLEKKYIKGQNLKQLKENLEKIEPQLTRLDQIFINQNRELEFITTLEGIANKNNVTQKINLGAPQLIDNQVYQKIPMQLFNQGNFLRQMNYLLGLEALTYYINIKSIEISPAPNQAAGNEEESDQSRVNFLIMADTYWE